MKDPTRIPPIMSALQDVWEALPDLDFADLLRLLENEGLVLANDRDALERLQQLGRRFPRTLGEGVKVAVAGQWFITAGPDLIAVWRPARHEVAPVVWPYQKIVSGQVGYPFHAIDTAGQHRRFGVIERILPIAPEQLAQRQIGQLRRSSIGDEVYLLVSTCGQKLVVGRTMQLFDPGRRDTTHTSFAWRSISATAVGEEAHIELADGAGLLAYGQLENIYRLR